MADNTPSYELVKCKKSSNSKNLSPGVLVIDNREYLCLIMMNTKLRKRKLSNLPRNASIKPPTDQI